MCGRKLALCVLPVSQHGHQQPVSFSITLYEIIRVLMSAPIMGDCVLLISVRMWEWQIC
jgi:hypothetical protein